METIKNHKTAFAVLIIAIVWLLFTIIITFEKVETNNTIVNNSILKIDNSEIKNIDIETETVPASPETLGLTKDLKETEQSTIPWTYIGEVINAGEYIANRPIYGLDLTIIYDKQNDTYIAEAGGIGDDDKIKYVQLSNNKLLIGVYGDVEIKNTFYGLNFNRKDVNGISTPENWCYDYDIGADVIISGDTRVITIPFNRNYGKGELLNLDLQFGLLP